MKFLLNSRITTTIFLAFCLFFISLIIKTLPELQESNNKLANANQQLEKLKKQQADIQLRNDYLKSDAYLERQVRLKLNYKQPNEKVVFIYQNPYTQDQKKQKQDSTYKDPSSYLNDIQSEPNWRKWLDYLLSN